MGEKKAVIGGTQENLDQKASALLANLSSYESGEIPPRGSSGGLSIRGSRTNELRLKNNLDLFCHRLGHSSLERQHV
jgi:hypothetical protein